MPQWFTYLVYLHRWYIAVWLSCGYTCLYAQSGGMLSFARNELQNAMQEKSVRIPASVQFGIAPALGEQAYTISGTRQVLRITGGDSLGLLYGSLELAEQIRLRKKMPDLSQPITGKPYLLERGLKFNIPLDIRTPSYQDAGDAAQQNIAEMWNLSFWKEYLDQMARNRYNVLTLWNPHPFPSMLRLKNYPGVALPDVCGTSFPLDTDRTDEPTAQFIAGCGVSQSVLDNLVVLKKMSIDEKIAFWQTVMRYAKDRGVKVYVITWNVWMNSLAPPGWYRDQKNKKGTEGKLGINNDQENLKTIAYLREAVKEFILTYPDLAGIGVTAGENMEDRDDAFDREKWLWATYGQGVLDAKRQQPGRQVEFIHRHWQSGVDKVVQDFVSKYPDAINLSFKYARARMYATPAPRWADEYIQELKKYQLKSWWNVRNDDIFHFRWGDPAFASAFVKNFPAEVTVGYFMGSDSYVWGREFISKHPASPRQLEVDKHWYNMMLWGRMGYNPDLPKATTQGLLALRYPGVQAAALHTAWATASAIPSLATRFHWHDWDFMWSVEGCLDLRKGFHTVDDFIAKPPMAGSGIIGIPEAVQALKNHIALSGRTPLQVAASLDSLAAATLAFTQPAHSQENNFSEEYRELLYDLDAFSYLGNYYADKIRAAYHLHAWRQLHDTAYRQQAIRFLGDALTAWKAYAQAATRNYRPQFLAKTRTVDWNSLTGDVKKELDTLKEQE